MTQWYEQLFENYATKYEQEPFTRGTVGEVDFIEKEIGPDRSTRILDIGCGTGRHSIELARRGYSVVGVDLSAAQLRRAQENAAMAKVAVRFDAADARKLTFRREFDVVIMICEGAFPLMETDEMNFEILKNAANALKPGGKFIFTTLNGLYPLFHSVKDFINSHYEGDVSKKNSFDLMTFRDISEYEVTDDSGTTMRLTCNERYYVPSEITWLLKSLGFAYIEILGCEIGAWRRDKPLTTEDFEMLVVARM
ncbi:MAG: class I SAM-dependent methyltransferase [Ignavibacteriales bacterium]|nr:class I SAM-dependent methyltransferase [Ignavibacteriales bacterium]